MLEEVNWGENATQWLTTLVDIINASFMTLNEAFAKLLAVGQKDIGGGGAGPITVAVTGLMASNYVSVTLVSSTNAVTISTVVPGAGSFDITFSGDPGASAIIVYQAFVSQPQ
jgi:hypothetical protein